MTRIIFSSYEPILSDVEFHAINENEIRITPQKFNLK
jgi:hypothetical protein